MLLYYIALPFIYLLSLMPFWLLYLLSDIVYFVLFKLLGYRKALVIENLTNSFPHKSKKEINTLASTFYRYFCDLLLESFKTLTIRKQQMLKRCSMHPSALQLLNSLADKQQSIILVLGHKGNWEWAGNTFSLLCKHQLYVIYHPLSNKYFDGLIYRMRSRFGTKLIDMRETAKEMIRNRGSLCATAFIADQSPHPDRAYWMDFLHQYTPVFMGTEKLSQKFNLPIVYMNVDRIKRGYYIMDAKLLIAEPATTIHGQITEAHTKMLEQDILRQPETWLWTHNRWKHKRDKQ